ncbi:MAG: SUMF1/EgtB/PvdO family nonheme iron enzyme [Spirosomataceae bacterium]
MSYKYFLLFLVTSIGLHSCLSWDLPDECTEGMPSMTVASNFTITVTEGMPSMTVISNYTITATVGNYNASWTLLNSGSQVIITGEGSIFTLNPAMYSNGNYMLRSIGKNRCGFRFDVSSQVIIKNELKANVLEETIIAGMTSNFNITPKILLNGIVATRSLISNPVIVNQPIKGTILVNSDGSLTYSARANASGSDLITYRICTVNDPSNCVIGQLLINITEFMPMVSILGGTFQMGDTKGEGLPTERPTRNVTLSNFQMGKYEVTQAQWQAVMGNNPSGFQNCPNCPVERVSWNDAIAFCNTLSDREGKQRVYTFNGTEVLANWNANGYRLPTEAEWEYAAGGGSTNRTRFGNGKDILDSKEANFDARTASDFSNVGVYRGSTIEVGSFVPNQLGLYDMTGNVWEWCWDWWGEYPIQSEVNPKGPSTGSRHSLRGGAWFFTAEWMRVALRLSGTPNNSDIRDGFRVVTQN